MFDFFKKKEKRQQTCGEDDACQYLDCVWMKHSLHFFYDNIRMCCSNAPGIMFYKDYHGEEIDWEKVYNIRKEAVDEINSEGGYPFECAGCCEIHGSLTNNPVQPFENKVTKVYIQNFMSCNAKCTYCTFGNVERGLRYKVLPHIKTLIEKGILSKHASVYMSGGEITISPEFEELLSTLYNYLESPIEIFTSGIKYCKSIEEAFKNNKLTMLLSLDSSTPETYKRIKQVDCFNQVVDNLKKYTQATDYAKNNITLKYILVDGENDNKDEIKGFIELLKELGIKNARLDLDFNKYSLGGKNKVPAHYYELYDFFNKECNNNNINVKTYNQIVDILEKCR